MHGFSQALIIRVCWLVMKRSRWEGLSAVWNGNVFLCFCSGLPRSGEPQNDICKVELQFSLSLSIHTYMHIYLYMFFMPIIRYTVYVYIYIYIYLSYDMHTALSIHLWWSIFRVGSQKEVTRFYGWKSHSYHLQGSNQTHPKLHPIP